MSRTSLDQSTSFISPAINGKELNKSLTRSLLESSSIKSSISSDMPQIELNSNSSKPLSDNEIIAQQHDSSNSNRIRTSKHENQSILSGEQRSNVTTPIPNIQTQLSSIATNHSLQDNIKTSLRLFTALYDYYPQTMSPNQNNNEELPFKQGQIIKV